MYGSSGDIAGDRAGKKTTEKRLEARRKRLAVFILPVKWLKLLVQMVSVEKVRIICLFVYIF